MDTTVAERRRMGGGSTYVGFTFVVTQTRHRQMSENVCQVTGDRFSALSTGWLMLIYLMNIH